MKTIILGAGITGLSAGIKTGGTILEASGKPGGICRSYTKKGYSFDIGGGHWIFKADPILKFLDKYSVIKPYTRNSGIYINNTFSYPFQDLEWNDKFAKMGTLKDWMHKKFGSSMCNMFFHPWNEKYTGGLYNYIIQDDEQKSPDIKTQGYNKYFYYPTQGLDTLTDNMAADCKIKYYKKVVKIDTKRKKVTCADGSSYKYDKLISTIPLCDLLDILEIEHKFPYTTCQVMNIGAVRGNNCPKEHWLYIPFCKSGFYRVGFYSNVVPRMAKEGKVSIYVEKTKLNDVPINIYRQNVIRELQEWGWIKECEVEDLNEIRVAYTWLYPDSNREKLLTSVNKLGIKSIGRYGKWKFQGISESIQEGLSC